MGEKYEVVYKAFKDLEDNSYLYKKGDIYPREGLKPSQKRIKELLSNKNKIGKILIKKVENSKDDKEPIEDEKVEDSEDNQEPTDNQELIEDKEIEDSKEEKESTENEKTTK